MTDISLLAAAPGLLSPDGPGADLLSAAELARARRHHQPVDRCRSATASWLLRAAAAGASGLEPHRVRVGRECPTCGRAGAEAPHGRPVLLPQAEEPGPPVQLSASHAGDVVLVAASTAGRVGVDVERIASTGFEGFDDLVLTPLERRHLASLPAGSRPVQRALAWTRKEALLKATGHALTLDPSTVGFQPDGRPEPATAALLGGAPHAGTRALGGLPAGHVGALALLDAPAPRRLPVRWLHEVPEPAGSTAASG
ncbi:4'-phosphopantetheinyl transferase family protein [Kineococcus sp. SYSU DK005]|uniref:4'-phosphopantetheinyl transferase family protein n=1 Tax=Kineococcus sp. SYSU DK005 TaxID=3383126 RepID=UPI003D7D3AE8